MKIVLLIAFALSGTGPVTAGTAGAPWEPLPVSRRVQPMEEDVPGESSLFGSVVEIALIAYRFSLSDQQGEICAFFPSCSEYADQALDSCGVVLGLLMIADRLERCNWTAGSYAPRYYKPATLDGKMVLRDPVKSSGQKMEDEE